MHVTFASVGINNKRLLQIDDAKITYRNFEGRESTYNRDGKRDFSLIVPTEDIKDALVNDLNEYGVGWNVKIKPPRDEDDSPFMHMKVKVKFTDYGPKVYLKSGGRRVRLDEESIGILDKIDISNVDLDIRPYDDIINGKPYRTAYLQSMEVTQDFSKDRFAARMAEEEYPGEPPF